MDIQFLNPVLLILFRYPQGVSLSFLMKQLGFSAPMVFRKVDDLKNQGYGIQYIDKFFLVKTLPFALIPEKVKLNIQQHDVPEILFIDQCASTNDLAKDLLSEFSSFFLLARGQYQGKGRMNRTWDMQKDKDLALSFGYTAYVPYSSFFSLIRAAALAVHETLNKFGVACFIKWPNDIINAQGKKICGILAEIVNKNNINSVVIGIGVNVNSYHLPDYAASVCQILGREIDINELAAHLIVLLNNFYSEFPKNELLIIEQWYKNLTWLGEKVIFQINNQEFVGIFRGCTQEGALQLQIDEQIQIFYVGDLHHIKFRKY